VRRTFDGYSTFHSHPSRLRSLLVRVILIKSEGEIGLETITHPSLITVIDPGGNGRDGYAALEHGSHVGGERHSGGVTAVTPTPYAGPVRVDPFVSLLQSSADIKGFFVSVPSAKVKRACNSAHYSRGNGDRVFDLHGSYIPVYLEQHLATLVS